METTTHNITDIEVRHVEAAHIPGVRVKRLLGQNFVTVPDCYTEAYHAALADAHAAVMARRNS